MKPDGTFYQRVARESLQGRNPPHPPTAHLRLPRTTGVCVGLRRLWSAGQSTPRGSLTDIRLGPDQNLALLLVEKNRAVRALALFLQLLFCFHDYIGYYDTLGGARARVEFRSTTPWTTSGAWYVHRSDLDGCASLV